MMIRLFFIMTCFIPTPVLCKAQQNDSVINRKAYSGYERYIYDPVTKTTNFSYDYSGKWDFDGDSKHDCLYLIGNGAAHIYFYPKIILSASGLTQSFPFILFDAHFIENKEKLDTWGKTSLLPFVVHDFTGDGIADIYFNFDNDYTSRIPGSWKRKGMTSKTIVISFKEGKINIVNYKF